jgi:hypothetical protein
MLRPGLRSAATSRAEAQVLRPGAIYAALDSSSVVGACRTFRLLIGLSAHFYLAKQWKMIDALLDNFLHLTVQRRYNRDCPSPVSRIQ